MANQNLSQFGEKLFVADADHTFIWDTAASISKRVSRNSWLNSGTLTSDAPVTISQTWNGTGSTVFKALVVNAVATGSTSSALSSLLDLQTSGASQLSLGQGFITFSNTSANVPASGFCMGVAGGQYMLLRAGNSSNQFTFSGTGLSLDNETHAIFFGGGVATAPRLYKDANYTLALRNGAAAQTFRVYNTYSNAGADYERGTFDWRGTANVLQIGTEKLGGGQARSVDVISTGQIFLTTGPGSSIDFRPAGITRWSIHTPGNLWATTDNAYDIGASNANRPRNVYVGTSLFTGVGGINFDINARLRSSATDVITLYNNGLSDFGRLQFGGTTNLFPSIKRSSTTLQARLADDSAFAPIQGKLTTETAFNATTVTPTGFITLYDSTGTAYKVPCVPA